MIRESMSAIWIALMTCSCDWMHPPPGKPLADGCYYAKRIPVLKVSGNDATLLVPGNVRSVQVRRDASPDQTGVTFTPGFHVRLGPPLTVGLVTDLPHSSMMMKPYAERPTIMGITDPPSVLDLVQGPPC